MLPIILISGSEGNRTVDISGHKGSPRRPITGPGHSLVILTLGGLPWESKGDDGGVFPLAELQCDPSTNVL